MIAELATFQSLAGGLKSAIDIAQSIVTLKDSAQIRAKAIELQAQVSSALASAISAQTSQMEMLERVRELEGQLVSLKDWEAEKQRYQPAHFPPGVVLHALKQEFVDAGEFAHELCPACYKDGHAMVLQATPETERRYRIHVCTACNTRLAYGAPIVPPPPPPAPDVGPGTW
jgi:hypothetical protein